MSAYRPDEALALRWAQLRVHDSRLPTPLMISHVAVTDLRASTLSFPEQPAGLGQAPFPPVAESARVDLSPAGSPGHSPH